MNNTIMTWYHNHLLFLNNGQCLQDLDSKCNAASPNCSLNHRREYIFTGMTAYDNFIMNQNQYFANMGVKDCNWNIILLFSSER